MWNPCLWQNSLPLHSVEEKVSPEIGASDLFLMYPLGTQLEDGSVSQWAKNGWTFETHEDFPGDFSYWEADKEAFDWSTHFGFSLRVLQSYCGWPNLFGWKQQCGDLGLPCWGQVSFLYSQPASSKSRSVNKREKIGTEQHLQLKLLCFLKNPGDNKRYPWHIILLY